LRQKEFSYESSRISKEALRKLQNHPAQRRHPGHLQQQTPQTAAGVADGVMDQHSNTPLRIETTINRQS
jgi:hypothetical protein